MTQKQTNPITTWVNELLLHFWSDYGLSYAVRWLSLFAIFISSTLFFTTAVQEPRLVLLILIAFIYTFVSTARYLKDLYELPDLRMALEYLLGCSLFPSLLPKISIANGKVLLKEGEVNLIDRSGGPGTITVDGKSVVLIERLNTYTKVLAEGKHKLERNEFIRDVVSLEEQHCKIENVEGMTVDGIRVRVHNIYARYQLKEKRTKPQAKKVDKDSEDNFIDDLMKTSVDARYEKALLFFM